MVRSSAVVIRTIVLRARILLVRIEVVKEKVIIFYSVLKMINYFLLLVYLDTKAATLIEDILVVLHHMVHFARKTASTSDNQLPFSLERILARLFISSTGFTLSHFAVLQKFV